MLGVINVLKPTGLTSSDVVVKVRGMLRAYLNDKKIKVGHLGTLDPNGSGVLPILFGKATRLFDYCLKDYKVYRACFVFGKTTDTLDSDGVVTECNDIIPTLADIERVVPDFIGVISQMPPLYSRVCVDGVRGYQAGRRGEEIVFEPRRVEIRHIDIISYANNRLWLDIDCGGGTYIRSLCRDIAYAVGTIAYMPCIIRLDNKGFKIEDSATIADLQGHVGEYIQPIDVILSDLTRLSLSDEEAFHLLNGVDIPPRELLGDYLLLSNDKIIGICQDNAGKVEVKIRLWE